MKIQDVKVGESYVVRGSNLRIVIKKITSSTVTVERYQDGERVDDCTMSHLNFDVNAEILDPA